MSPFEDFPDAILPATYTPVDHRDPLGASEGTPIPVSVIFDEGSSVAPTGQPLHETADVLFYAQSSPLDELKCVGGYITVAGRTFRVDSWNVARDGEQGTINHYELSGQEVES